MANGFLPHALKPKTSHQPLSRAVDARFPVRCGLDGAGQMSDDMNAVTRRMLLAGATVLLIGCDDRPVADIETAQRAIASMHAQYVWDTVKIDEATTKSYSLSLWYKPAVAVFDDNAQADTIMIVRAVLADLVNQGRRPKKDKVKVSVVAYRHGLGNKSEDLIAEFGYASYDYNTDSVSYHPKQ
jgi:hypothetical protein